MAEILTVYPDAGTGNTTVDGNVAQTYFADQTWTSLVGDTGNTASPSETTISAFKFVAGNTDGWRQIYRGIYLFDTSSLGAGATINSGIFSIYGSSKADNASISPTLNVYSSAPASNSDLANGDYDSLGTTAFSSNLAYASMTTGAYNNFTLNATGESAISKTSVTKLGTRESTYDAPDNNPGFPGGMFLNSEFVVVSSGAVGTTQDPKLVINYTAGVAPTDTGAFLNFMD